MKYIWSHPKLKPVIISGIVTALLGVFGAPWFLIWIIFILIIISTEFEKPIPTGVVHTPAHLAPDVLSRYIQSAPKASLLLDKNGRIVFINKSLTDLFPYVEMDQAFAQAFRTPKLIEAVSQATNGQEVKPLIYKSARYLNRVFEARFSKLSEPFDEVLNATTMIEFEDITQNERNEAVKRDFIANASHELRTPLTTIQGAIETLSHNKDDDGIAERFLPIMKSQADRMQRLIDDLLSLSKIEDQRPITKDSNFDLTKTINRALEVYKTNHTNIQIENLFDDKEIMVNGNEDQITQVIINLIDNAIKHSGARNIYILRAEDNPKHVGQIGVIVKDDGNGIDPKYLPRLTERFYRAGTPQKTGTGLGLAIVKHILIRHGGSFEIDSVVGEGSQFTFWINTK